ncbi:MAG: transglutaminase family protein [Alphaproteobacteria bacterium]|nr:transglutaminase family protein [Alphaproteobacteria bacterium]
MIRYAVKHRTEFLYSSPVAISHHLLHLTPRATDRQRIDGWRVVLTPAPAIRRSGTDFFGNAVEHLTIQDEHQTLVVQAGGTVVVEPGHGPAPSDTVPWEDAVIIGGGSRDADVLAAQPFAFDADMTRAGDAVRAWARQSFAPGRPLLDAALELNHRVYEAFEYDPAATTITTPVDEVFDIRRGVCQDFAHLMLACLRGMGLAARYISGYLLTYPPPGGEKLQGSDASHAWVAVRVPEVGWIDLDPTNDKIATTEHITLAWGRDYADVSPVKGAIVGGGKHEVKVDVDVRPLDNQAAATAVT